MNCVKSSIHNQPDDSINFASHKIEDIKYGELNEKKMFIAANCTHNFYSEDGKVWTSHRQSSNRYQPKISFGELNGKSIVVIVNANNVAYSEDGKNWQQNIISNMPSNQEIKQIIFAKDVFYIIIAKPASILIRQLYRYSIEIFRFNDLSRWKLILNSTQYKILYKIANPNSTTPLILDQTSVNPTLIFLDYNFPKAVETTVKRIDLQASNIKTDYPVLFKEQVIGIVHNDTKTVYVGIDSSSSKIVISRDRQKTFTPIIDNEGSHIEIKAIFTNILKYGNGIFVAISMNNDNSTSIITSSDSDGNNWNKELLIGSINNDNSTSIITSSDSDGNNWNKKLLTELKGIATSINFINGNFYTTVVEEKSDNETNETCSNSLWVSNNSKDWKLISTISDNEKVVTTPINIFYHGNNIFL